MTNWSTVQRTEGTNVLGENVPVFPMFGSIVRSIPSAVPPSGQVQGDHWGWDREGDCWRWDREGVCWRWDWEVDYWRQRCRRNCHPVLQGPCHKVIKQ